MNSAEKRGMKFMNIEIIYITLSVFFSTLDKFAWVRYNTYG